ncbi:hypothetical protein DL769_003521 [Monosporascus sp. CRB-8-3]|nr:hypothetical protein DL769_003521 [Monosporascus sp. CRB-8-3]
MSAFSTFSGSSKKPRNVNLSGQRTNPWAATSWSPSSSGASKSVAQAQAEREKRHRERQELNAATRLQRLWRGHRDRQLVKQRCREDFDALFNQPVPHSPSSRVDLAFPLLLALFDPSRHDDQHRLDLLVQDLAGTGSVSTASKQTASTAWDRLAQLLVRALEKRPASSSQAILSLLVDIVKRRSSSVLPILDRYYKLLARYFEESGHAEIPLSQQQVLAAAVSVPLRPGSRKEAAGLRAYQAFAYSFLTSSRLILLQQSPAQIAQFLDLEALSQGIVETFSTGQHVNKISKDGLLWLLAHFIALNRSVSKPQGSLYLEALYLQLSVVATDIRIRSTAYQEDDDDDDDDDASDISAEKGIKELGPLPHYVTSQLEFLVNEDGISTLLTRFTSTASSSTRLTEDASLLAGFTLILLRCFSGYGDDIKMRFFQGDIATVDSSGQTALPCVKYFWKAVSKADVFFNIQRDSTVTAALLQEDAVRDREWRTILLFLELYNFLLRVTDDEDFLQGETQLISQQSPATLRIRSSNLSLPELKQLIEFLKNLSFTLYHDLADILPSASQPVQLDSLMGVGPKITSSRDTAMKPIPSSFAGIIGMDVLGLRNTVTTTLRSLYERDSRRPFLPKDFWLMPKKFDMKSFVSAVVLEEQRKNDMDQDDDESGDSEVETRNTFHNAAISRLSRAARIEQQRGRGSREKLLAKLVPKLEILRNMPFIIPFDTRVQIFREFVNLDKFKRRGGYIDPDRWRLWVLQGEGGLGPSPRGRELLGRHTASVKRGQVFDDAFDQFYSLGEGIKEPIQITFVDQFNQPEAGIDGGGVTKEFLTSIAAEAFDPSPDGHSFFVTNKQNLLYPNPTAFDERADMLRFHGFEEGSAEFHNGMQNLAKRYEFLGRIVGKCMYEGILIDIAFAPFFLLKWSSSGQSAPADYRANLNDLRDLDPELYQGLINLKNYPGDVADLSLDFTITDQFRTHDGGVRTVTRPLRKDGENIPVTNKDRPLYISYVASHRLIVQPYRQTKAFLRGLGSIINPSWLSMFNQSELQRLVGGDSSEIDVEDLRRNTIYSGLYAIGDDGMEHPTVQMFWQVMHSLRDEERREVLKYVTSTPRAPLLGFSQLSPRFSIRDGGTEQDRLPSTSTCVNLLKLPRYKDPETLKSKLLYAIKSGAGFDLS